MKKTLGNSAFIVASFLAYMASAKVEFNLTGNVSGHVAYGSVDFDLRDTVIIKRETMLVNTRDQEFKDNGGQENNVNFSIWTGGSLSGEISTTSTSGVVYIGHFRIFDGSDGREDIYVSVRGLFGTVFLGEHNFSSEIMMVGGVNYDIDDTGGYDKLVGDGYTPKKLAKFIYDDYLPNYVEPVTDTDLADGTINRLMYISPNLLGGYEGTGLYVGGYVALSNDQIDDYDHKWISDKGFSDGLVYGAGLSFETDLSDVSSVVVETSIQMTNSVYENSTYYGAKTEDTILYRIGAKYTLGDIAIKGFWNYHKNDSGEAHWTDTGGATSPTDGTTFLALTHLSAHTFDVGVEYVIGAFTCGIDVIYTMADIDAYKGTSGSGAGTVNAVNGTFKKMKDTDTSDYVGLGAGISVALLDGVTFKIIEAHYVHGSYTAIDGSSEDIVGIAYQDTDYELNYVSVSTGLEIEF